jgi:hypothetical protein
VLLAGCGSEQPPIPLGHPRSDLISIFEGDGQLQPDPAAQLAAIKALGAHTVRFNVFWSQIAPDASSRTRPPFDAADPAAYPQTGWVLYDQIDRDAAAAGLQLYLTLTGPAPIWATAAGAPRGSVHANAWKPDAADFGAFVHAIGVRYSGRYVPPGSTTPLPRVDFWSIWNEPNYGPDLAPQAADGSSVLVAPRLYRNLLRAAWSSLRASGHGPATDTILIGETAPRGIDQPPKFPGNFAGTVPMPFIRALYCVGSAFQPLRGTAAALLGCPVTAAGSGRFEADNPALFDATGFADHPYEDALAPDNSLGDLPGYADFSQLGRLETTLDQAAAAYGSHARLPIYSTEFGYNTSYASEANSARFMNQAEYLSWLNPRVRAYDQYLMVDPASPSTSGFDTGLYSSDGKPKPSLNAYRMPLWMPVTRASSGSKLAVWGCARPAPALQTRYGRPQRVAIQFAAGASSAFHTIRTVTLHSTGGCYFEDDVTFPGSGSVRLQWSGAGSTYRSRVQPIS